MLALAYAPLLVLLAAELHNALQPARASHVDYIEIGCSDFGTLLEEFPRKTGISVEPVPHYLHSLPDRPGGFKLNAAVSDETGEGTIYWVDPHAIDPSCDRDFLRKHSMSACLPNWLRGTSTVDEVNLSSREEIRKLGGDPDDAELYHVTTIPFLQMTDVLDRYGVDTVEYLKVDTEGHDVVVMRSMLDAIRARPERAPQHIFYENLHVGDGVKAEHNQLCAELDRDIEAAGYTCWIYTQKFDGVMSAANTACSRVDATTPFPDKMAI